MSTPVLELKNGRKSYGANNIFSNLNISLEEDQITVLYGPSGIGKTTLLKCLALLEPLDKGNIYVRGKQVVSEGQVFDEATVRKEVGMVFQDFYLWDNKTVLGNITEALVYVKGMSNEEAQQIARRISKDLDIKDELLQKYPPELSRGQRQRIAIARTLATNPEVILLDEPTASLDEAVVKELGNLLRSLKEKKKTILIVTHDTTFAHSVGDKVVSFSELQGRRA